MKDKKEERFTEADYIIWSCGGEALAKGLYGRRYKKLKEACINYESEKFYQELKKRLKKIENK